MALALCGALLGHAPAHAATHRAALVIEHSVSWPGPHVVWKCVEFAQEAISGLALLELAGVNSGQPPQVYDWGGGADTVCQIDHQPPQIPDRCFGPMSGPNWSDWHASVAGWVPRSASATGYTVQDGDLEGWTYATGFGVRPPSVTFSQLCPASVPPAAHAASTVASPPTRSTAPPASVRTTPATARPTPSLGAAAPPTTPTVQASIAAAPASSEPPSASSAPPLLLFGTVVALLLGLFAWNDRRRGS